MDKKKTKKLLKTLGLNLVYDPLLYSEVIQTRSIEYRKNKMSTVSIVKL